MEECKINAKVIVEYNNSFYHCHKGDKGIIKGTAKGGKEQKDSEEQFTLCVFELTNGKHLEVPPELLELDKSA